MRDGAQKLRGFAEPMGKLQLKEFGFSPAGLAVSSWKISMLAFIIATNEQ